MSPGYNTPRVGMCGLLPFSDRRAAAVLTFGKRSVAEEGKGRQCVQGERILIYGKEHFGKVGIIPTGFEPLDFDTAAATRLLPQ